MKAFVGAIRNGFMRLLGRGQIYPPIRVAWCMVGLGSGFNHDHARNANVNGQEPQPYNATSVMKISFDFFDEPPLSSIHPSIPNIQHQQTTSTASEQRAAMETLSPRSILSGALFGAALTAAGVYSPTIIIQQMHFEDFRMMKAFLSAAASSAYVPLPLIFTSFFLLLCLSFPSSPLPRGQTPTLYNRGLVN